MHVLERVQMIIALIFCGSSRWGTLATGRERRGKRLVFEILLVITTIVTN